MCIYSGLDFADDEVPLTSLGENVSSVSTKTPFVKISSLTGGQAHSLMRHKVDGNTKIYPGINEIINITEGPCKCEEVKSANGPEDVCARCMVHSVWIEYAENIFPLLVCKTIPKQIKDAMEKGELDLEMARIQKTCQKWLSRYRRMFGPRSVTPYVHIIGKHLPLMLSQCGYSIGEWSQQGFEACHKVIRRVFHHCTLQGGVFKSALLQIEEYLYRRSWALLRHQFECVSQGGDDDNEEATQCMEIVNTLKSFAEKEYFLPLDGDFYSEFPPDMIKRYAAKRSSATAARIRREWNAEIMNSIPIDLETGQETYPV